VGIPARRFSIATAYLGMGSNLGDRHTQIHKALDLLQRDGSVKILRSSSVYETEPVGVRDQPLFLNAVVKITTKRTPRDLLALLQTIERCLGRRRTTRWGPRWIDLDLLLYDDLLIQQPDLIVPHPELPNRAFVLVPLAEIAPDAVHPGSGKTIPELLARVHGTEGVRLYHSGGNREHD
jgi:2-amino-4-hydroxy-6-hydroxymethyldihydropteridine diphosphokinase